MADRYISDYAPDPSDSNLMTDGDSMFIGMDALTQPENIQTGYVQYAQNMRFDKYQATVR